MNSARIELKLIIDQLEMLVQLDTFSQRFNLQKKVYLAQICGVDSGYRFGWYLRGPYSQGLTADAFALRDEISDGDREYEEYCLPDEAAEQLGRAKQLFQVPEKCDISSDQWLELLASLHYLRHVIYRPRDQSRDFANTFNLLAKSKPQFAHRKRQATIAWQSLEEVGLIEAKRLA